jgi:DNA-binding CsgD family transcriptional regulator
MTAVRPILSPLLVGRDELLQLSERRIAEAAGSHGRLLLLAGEAGVGKSRLLGAVIRKAQAAGFLVSKGDLAPQDRQVPLASVLDLARTMLGARALAAVGQDVLDLCDRAGRFDGDTLGNRRILVLEIARRIIDAVESPTLLAFDDLQWADELSLEVVGELARLVPDRPVLLVGAYRVTDIPAASYHREWRARLLTQRIADELRLEPLTQEQTALVTTLILGTGLPAPREVVDAVHRRTDGIPLHIEELLGALGDDARADGRAILDAHVPSTIEDAILARFARLSPDARAVARAGAVVGRCFVPEVLAGIMDRAPGDLDEPLGELVDHAFLFPFEFVDRGFFDFRHQLLRDALYGTVPATELRRLHARAAEFGTQIPGSTAIHASVHFERAGLRGQAFRAALSGAQAASAVTSRREAYELYGRAVANLPDGLPAGELAEVWAGYAGAASAVDNVPVMEEAARRARAHYLEAGRPIEAADMLLLLAGAARRDVRPVEERMALKHQAREELDRLAPSPERDAELYEYLVMRAIDELDLLRLGDAADTLAEARRLAEASGDPELLADCSYWQAALDVLQGRTEIGLRTTMLVAREARDRSFESAGVTAYRNAAILAARALDYATASHGIAEGLRYADEIEQSYCRHLIATTSALVAWAQGYWDEALQVAGQELVEPASRRTGIGARDALGYVALGRGDVERARSLLDDSLAAGRVSGEVALVLSPLWGLAEAALLGGDPQRAVDHCDEALDLAVTTGERALFVPFVVTGVRAQLAARRPGAVAPWLERCRAHLAGWEQIATPALEHGDGLHRLAAGSTVLARTSLEQAVSGWDRLGRTWEASWARLDLGACLLRANRPTEALPVLRAVRSTAEDLASEPLLARARELVALARSRGAEEEPWRPLSAREFEVARLVADGLTNAAIADALGLSPRTVGAHVEHILAKLGVTRRAEIAAWAVTVQATGSATAEDASGTGARTPAAAVARTRR